MSLDTRVAATASQDGSQNDPRLSRMENAFFDTNTAPIVDSWEQWPSPTPDEVDVVVIGAGLAGLTAAQHIVASGHSCRVLEARNRVGGRSWSRSIEGGIVDVGAAWINDSNQSCMIALARKFNAELVTQNTSGQVIFQDAANNLKTFSYGELPGFSADIKEDIARIRDTVESSCQALDVNSTSDTRSTKLDSMTFLEYLLELDASEEAIDTATIWTRAMLGQEPRNISALFFLHYCKAGGGLMQMRSDCEHGGQYLRVRLGTQMFAINIAKTLPEETLVYDSPVTSIKQSDSQRVIVECKNTDKTIRARKVICAVPPGNVAHISFQPPLSGPKQRLIDSYHYGYYQKMMVVFKTPFWTSRGFCGLVQSFRGPACVIRDTSVAADGKYVLTCFLGGDPAISWSNLGSEHEKQEVILKQIEEAFNDVDIVRSQYLHMVGHQWSDEQWSGYGCPSPATAPNVLSTVGHMLATNEGDVHFAGTETSTVWRGYMEGAVRSGDREAQRVIELLQTEKDKHE